MTPLKAEYIGADQLPLIIFRLQLCGGPYIPISRVVSRGRCNTGLQFICRGSKSQGLSRAVIETQSDRV